MKWNDGFLVSMSFRGFSHMAVEYPITQYTYKGFFEPLKDVRVFPPDLFEEAYISLLHSFI